MTRVFVVTGSNKGIGKSIVKLLLKDSEQKLVYLTSRNEELGQQAVKDLEKLGLKPKYHQLDITDQNSIDRLRDYISKNYGGLDVLVNNAGIANRGESPHNGAVLTNNCNFFGTLNVCDAFLPLLKPNGVVVHVSSISSVHAYKRLSPQLKEKFTEPNLTIEGLKDLIQQFIECAKSEETLSESGWPKSAYGISKLGVSFLTILQQKQLDENESGRNIKIFSCCPGLVETDLTRGKHGDLPKKTTDEGADTPVYLALQPKDSPLPKGCFYQNRVVTNFPPLDE